MSQSAGARPRPTASKKVLLFSCLYFESNYSPLVLRSEVLLFSSLVFGSHYSPLDIWSKGPIIGCLPIRHPTPGARGECGGGRRMSSPKWQRSPTKMWRALPQTLHIPLRRGRISCFCAACICRGHPAGGWPRCREWNRFAPEPARTSARTYR